MGQIAIRKRLGTTSELSTILGKDGDQAVDISKHTITIFDGITPGGFPLSKEGHTHSNATDTEAGFMSASDHIYLYTHGHAVATSLADGFMSAIDKAKLDLITSGGIGTPSSSSAIPNTLALRDSNGDFAGHFITAAKFIGALQGNADTVTNGVYTTGSYADPSWITSIDGSKITGVLAPGVVTWSSITGKPSVVSYFINDAGYINGSGNTTGTSGGVLSAGGRETDAATPQTVVFRDAAGRAKVVAPVAALDIANKAYVDANVGGGAYRPVTAIISNTHACNGNGMSVSSIFTNEVICNLTSEKGILYSLSVDSSGWVGNTPYPGNAITVEITVDGSTPYLATLTEYFQFFGNITAQTIGGSVGSSDPNGFATSVLLTQINYSTSLLIRWSSTGFTKNPSTDSPYRLRINRFIKV
jgi:hypothetical protein